MLLPGPRSFGESSIGGQQRSRAAAESRFSVERPWKKESADMMSQAEDERTGHVTDE